LSDVSILIKIMILENLCFPTDSTFKVSRLFIVPTQEITYYMTNWSSCRKKRTYMWFTS